MTHKAHLQVDVNFQGEGYSLIDAACKTLDHVGAAPGEMTLVLTDEKTIQDLNAQFREVDEPTDVLSFPDGTTDIETGIVYFGDVVIALPIAQDHAMREGHTLNDELILLTVHGVLHLVGFDHLEGDEQRAMWSIQNEILQLLGCSISSPKDLI
ncbi:MAG: rRNA maturation RNase YbeY [Anaerolineales bacterium]|nr:rRNA maturation RNase YbeY [Anaerolineales bacterium]